METVPQTKVVRVRRVDVEQRDQVTPPAGTYRGFGTVRGETAEQFHDRMFDIDPFEAMCYEMELEFTRIGMH